MPTQNQDLCFALFSQFQHQYPVVRIRSWLQNPEVNTYSHVSSLRHDLWDTQIEVVTKRWDMGISIGFKIVDKLHKTPTRDWFLYFLHRICAHARTNYHPITDSCSLMLARKRGAKVCACVTDHGMKISKNEQANKEQTSGRKRTSEWTNKQSRRTNNQGGETSWSDTAINHNGTMARWQDGMMARWYNGTMAQWHNDTMVWWHEGTVVQRERQKLYF